MDKDMLSRREFIKNVGSTALAAMVVSPVLGTKADASSGKPPLPMQPVTLDLSKPDYTALARTGGALKIPNPHNKNRPIIVSRTSETTVAAFSSKCTHFGCEVGLPENNLITCHCHGSKFDGSGKVVHGPARKDLAQFSAVLEGSTITVKDMAA